MTAQWYLSQHGKQLGPFTPAQLQEMVRDGKLAPDDLVTQVGAKQWTPAKEVKGLSFRGAVALQPNLPPLPTQLPPLPSSQTTTTVTGSPPATAPSPLRRIIVIVAGAVAGLSLLVCAGAVKLYLDKSPTHFISAPELTKEFRKDMIAADRKYKDRQVSVSGLVRMIDRDNRTVHLEGGQGEDHVVCNIWAVDMAKVPASWKPGVMVSLRGRYLSAKSLDLFSPKTAQMENTCYILLDHCEVAD